MDMEEIMATQVMGVNMDMADMVDMVDMEATRNKFSAEPNSKIRIRFRKTNQFRFLNNKFD